MSQEAKAAGSPGLPGLPHFAPKAKRVIFLFMSGGLSQFESFDHKPLLNKRMGEEMPASLRQGKELLGMSKNQASFKLAGYAFCLQATWSVWRVAQRPVSRTPERWRTTCASSRPCTRTRSTTTRPPPPMQTGLPCRRVPAWVHG